MKSLAYFLLSLSILFFRNSNSCGLLPSKPEKQLTTSSYTIERKGTSYTATNTKGCITRPVTQMNSYFMLSADFVGNGKNITVAIYLRNQDDLTVGKMYSLSGNGNLGKDSRKPRTILYVEFERNATDESKTITSGSESGTLVFTALHIVKNKAIVSGRYEFQGKNDNSLGNEKEVSVKGRFTNIEVKLNESNTSSE